MIPFSSPSLLVLMLTTSNGIRPDVITVSLRKTEPYNIVCHMEAELNFSSASPLSSPIGTRVPALSTLVTPALVLMFFFTR